MFSKDENGPFLGLFSAQKSSEFHNGLSLLRTWCKSCESISAYVHCWTLRITASQSSPKPSGNIGDILLDIPEKWHEIQVQNHRNYAKSGFFSNFIYCTPQKNQDFHCSLKSHLWQPLTPSPSIMGSNAFRPARNVSQIWVPLVEVNAGDMEDVFEALSGTRFCFLPCYKMESLVFFEARNLLWIGALEVKLIAWLDWLVSIWGQVLLDAQKLHEPVRKSCPEVYVCCMQRMVNDYKAAVLCEFGTGDS